MTKSPRPEPSTSQSQPLSRTRSSFLVVMPHPRSASTTPGSSPSMDSPGSVPMVKRLLPQRIKTLPQERQPHVLTPAQPYSTGKSICSEVTVVLTTSELPSTTCTCSTSRLRSGQRSSLLTTLPRAVVVTPCSPSAECSTSTVVGTPSLNSLIPSGSTLILMNGMTLISTTTCPGGTIVVSWWRLSLHGSISSSVVRQENSPRVVPETSVASPTRPASSTSRPSDGQQYSWKIQVTTESL